MKVLFASTMTFVFVLVIVQNKTPAPALLDAIHYCATDRQEAEEFFIEHFGARIMPHPGPRTLEFVSFLSLRAGEATINISSQGPFPGVSMSETDRWQGEAVQPSEDLPPIYGVRWLGIRTASLNQTLTRLEIEGVRVTQRMLSLPHDILARAVMIEGPDFNQIILVERKEQQNTKKADKVVWGDFGIDHILLLVKNVKDNEIFFQDVFAGRVTGRRLNVTTMRVANSTIVLAEPESLGLKRENIEPQNIKKLRYGIDQLGFLYADVRPAVSAAMEKGYKFLIDGVRMNYYGVPTAYVVAVTHSPDGVRCEMVQEEGRKGPRIKVEIK